MRNTWKFLLPPCVTLLLALLPVPEGLAPHAWYFFSLFAGVVVGLIFEPLPGAVIGLIGVAIAAALAPWVLFSPEQLATQGFKAPSEALKWGLSGFANNTVWLIFSAFMFALGYEKTGLGRRIALLLVKRMGGRTLTLGYAVLLADLLLAPFTPSNTARSGGTIYPVIRNLPPLYDSRPNDPSARRIGSYLMWVAIASTCVTSSLFMTALAPNLLASALIEKTAGIHISWGQWFIAAAPVGLLLLAVLPLLAYWLYPPQIKSNAEVPAWAARELAVLGPLSRNEKILLALVAAALGLWIFGSAWFDAALVGILVIVLMLLTRVITWDDALGNKAAWNTFAWFATLVALADGLTRVGFVPWFGQFVAAHLGGFTPTTAMVLLVVVFYLAHYLFASSTAHTTALLPVMLAAGMGIGGIDLQAFALLLGTSLGLMGIITPYGTGPSPVYYGSGYLPSADYWRLGSIFGALFLLLLLGLGVPWILALS
ncbi:anion permease [Phytopseudomonas flavescens]|nr:anion permease [Pseudomonas flavescens]